MFVPLEFKEVRAEEIEYLIKEFPLACVVVNTEQGLIATHLPLIKKGDDVLLGHISMENEMHKLAVHHQEVMCIFKGNDAYISANYYPSKFEDHKKVPTWNYQAVHIYGNIEFFTDKKSKMAAIGLLTKQSEQKTNDATAWKISDAPADYIDLLLKDLIVFEVKISRILAQSKLSQNKEKRDFDAVIQQLQSRGNIGVANSMLRLKSK